METVFFTKESFELWVEKQKQFYGDSYLDTLLGFMEKFSVDEEDIKELLSPNLILKLKNEAIENKSIKNNIKRTDFNQVFTVS